MNFIYRFLKSSFLINENRINISWILTCEWIKTKIIKSKQINDKRIKFFLNRKS